MLTTYPADGILADVRASVDRIETDEGVADASIYRFIDSEYKALRRKLGDLVPDLFTERQTFSIVAPATSWTITPSDVGKLRRAEVLLGGTYCPMRVAPALNPEASSERCYRLRGTAIDIYPSAAAAGDYRAEYVTKPSATITSSLGTALLPTGADRVLVEAVCMRVRAALEEPEAIPGHQAFLRAAWDDLKAGLIDQYLSTPQLIAETY